MSKVKLSNRDELRAYVLKAVETISMGLLNLEVQVVQIKDDEAARGASVAVNHIRTATEDIKSILKNFKEE